MGKGLKTLQRLSGIGKVHISLEEDPIATVDYILLVQQEFLSGRAIDGGEEIPGIISISGKITVIAGERMLIDGQLMILVLEDGRTWSFFAKRGGPVSGNYQVVTGVAGNMADWV